LKFELGGGRGLSLGVQGFLRSGFRIRGRLGFALPLLEGGLKVCDRLRIRLKGSLRAARWLSYILTFNVNRYTMSL
jgi:hypothetical protein